MVNDTNNFVFEPFQPQPMAIENAPVNTSTFTEDVIDSERVRFGSEDSSPFDREFEANYVIYPCSEYMKQFIESYEDKIGLSAAGRVIRWDTPIHVLKIGESFAHPINPKDYQSLYIHVTNVGKTTGKKFKMKSHSKHGVYEVCRIA